MIAVTDAKVPTDPSAELDSSAEFDSRAELDSRNALDPCTGLPEPPQTTIRVAAVQAEAVPGEVAHNAMTVARLMREAADRGVRLVVFPELFLCAYHPPVLSAHPQRCDVPADEESVVADLRLEPIREAARDTGIVAVVGASVSRPDESRKCSALLAGPDGVIRAVYDKQHLCGAHERALFSPGEQGCTIRLDTWSFGIGICYDGCFPEHARAAATAGAHGYLCPSGYVVGSHPRRDLYYPARALDNTFYVVFANSVGGVYPWQLSGGAAIYDPQGQTVDKGDDSAEHLVVADLDPEELTRVRKAHTMLAEVMAYGPNLGSRRIVTI